MDLGWQEILLIMVFALIVFGPKKLPEIGRQIGKAMREIRRVSGQFEEEIRTGLALDEESFPYMKGPASSGEQRDAGAGGGTSARDRTAPPPESLPSAEQPPADSSR